MVTKLVNSLGDIRYRNEQGQLHREDGPAIEYSNGDKFWIVNDSYHRLDGPALEYASGDRCWYINNLCHRLGGPAEDYNCGYKAWWKNGDRHRLNAPAIIRASGVISFYELALMIYGVPWLFGIKMLVTLWLIWSYLVYNYVTNYNKLFPNHFLVRVLFSLIFSPFLAVFGIAVLFARLFDFLFKRK